MACALTTFGKHCRELRVAKNQTMGDQAKALSCDVHHISSIETAKLTPNSEYLEKIRQWLLLDDKEFAILKRRTKSNIVNMKPVFSTSNNSTSMRLFQKISKLEPDQIRKFRTKIEGEVEDD